MSVEDVADRYLDSAARAEADAEVLVVRSQRQEIVARGGRAELSGESTETEVALRLQRGDRRTFVTASASADVTTVLALALDSLQRLPPAPPLDPPSLPPVADGTAPSWLPAEKVQSWLVTATRRGKRDHDVELRSAQELRVVAFADTEGRRGAYETAAAALHVRVTAGGASGKTGHAELDDRGASLATVLERGDDALRRAGTTAELLAGGGRAPTDGTVVLEPEVVAGLVALLARSFQADAVAQRRSRLSGRLGASLAPPYVTLVDDPLRRQVALRAPFDDEGSATRRRALLDQGTVAGYLADRRYAAVVDGSPPGCAWRSGTAVPPRPSPRSLVLEPAGSPLAVDGPILRIVQSYGLHMANDVTGDFSMGAAAISVRDGDIAGVVGCTVAGNVFDVFAGIEAVGDELRWSRAGGASVGAPALVVRGLTIGA